MDKRCPILVVQIFKQKSLYSAESSTGKTKIELAEESGLRKVHLDKSSYYTRTLDKYLDIETLPKRPRWRDVIKTAEYVLKQATSSENQELQNSLNNLKENFPSLYF